MQSKTKDRFTVLVKSEHPIYYPNPRLVKLKWSKVLEGNNAKGKLIKLV